MEHIVNHSVMVPSSYCNAPAVDNYFLKTTLISYYYAHCEQVYLGPLTRSDIVCWGYKM